MTNSRIGRFGAGLPHPLPTAPPASEVRGAVDKTWTSPAALDSALTQIGPGRVQLISEPRQWFCAYNHTLTTHPMFFVI